MPSKTLLVLKAACFLSILGFCFFHSLELALKTLHPSAAAHILQPAAATHCNRRWALLVWRLSPTLSRRDRSRKV